MDTQQEPWYTKVFWGIATFLYRTIRFLDPIVFWLLQLTYHIVRILLQIAFRLLILAIAFVLGFAYGYSRSHRYDDQC
ncbi:hypothetical protein [Sulfobacillus thermosulfidooxidans]|uniref:hypothetical protein n=1 Tax=Sulfobacillus thermosulfidooxidans TaxID=28034 RepID=UPI0006B67EFD|nr:hypothetical protein [Sulfobacillus thermosulfidooxidans]